ncbi:MAG: TRAP transporter small permease [Deltaproteobacteria bacterium]|jgi:TRAP-type transport system small permease protein|nr:TRAP transporter small permease [Deltaproteobacteria bacterium]MBT4267644.1 TRAP transporter small permease [Deltaproteobacteria bacterium]MBT4642268.1 TRAP transporter small permease [Deltaproteobacteria bacterium]MBT6502532.1 TRAP transporter small permease [Deltaproteobacteria bacterium]MBT6610914.1 TRAP transporter small permease [Deltaproteobacteria bacterium]
MKTMQKGLKRFNDSTIWLCNQVEIALIALMMIVILIQVFFRYVLNNSLVWPEETARFLMVWMTFIAAPIAYRMGLNVSLDFVLGKLKGRIHTFLMVLIQIGVLATLIILFQKSLGMVERGVLIDATSIPIKLGYIYISMPIGLFLTSMVNIEILLNSLGLLVIGNSEYEVQHLELSGE